MDRTRRLRPLWLGVTALLGIAFVVEAFQLYGIIDGQQAIGTDLDYYRFVADRWLDTGVFYTPEQLSGPYVVQTQVHNLYPPHALYLFVPFLFLPEILWWIIPLGVVAYVVWWCRPGAWGLAVLLLLLLLPKGPAQILFGNTDMWIAAFVAGGIRWSWPAVLVSIKPSLGLFAFVGIRSKAWWLAVVVVAALSVPLLSYWLQYPVIARNSSAQLSYSFTNLPFFFLPIAAWLVSSRRGATPISRWSLGLLRGGNRTIRETAA